MRLYSTGTADDREKMGTAPADDKRMTGDLQPPVEPLMIQFFHMGMSGRNVSTRFMGIYQAQFRGLENAGAKVRFTEGQPEPECDVVITSTTPPHERAIDQVLKYTRAPVVLYVPPATLWFDQRKLLRMRERLLFVYSPSQSAITENRYAELGIPFLYLPFGADPMLMRPLSLEPIYDVVFVGGLSHRRGYEPFIEPLLARLGTRSALFVGAGWEKYGLPSQTVAYGELLNLIYNLGRVCINFHSAEQKQGAEVQLDLNNRVFDLAMAGCVQVSDNAEALRRYFREDEIVMVDSPEEWVDQVFHQLGAPEEERAQMRQRVRQRALAEHTWDQRGKQFLNFLLRILAQKHGPAPKQKWSLDSRWFGRLFSKAPRSGLTSGHGGHRRDFPAPGLFRV